MEPRQPHRVTVPCAGVRRPAESAGIHGTQDQMPESIYYDPDDEVLHIGDGAIVNVNAAMWEYRVSGTQVVRDWFNDRKKDRRPTVIGDRTVSPLWQVHSDCWRASYTTELLDLLNVLGRLVLIEPDQDTALSAVVGGETWTVEELTAAGVLPIQQARRAVHIEQSPESEGLFELDSH